MIGIARGLGRAPAVSIATATATRRTATFMQLLPMQTFLFHFFDLGRLDHLSPLWYFGLDARGEMLRRVGDRVEAK